MHGMSAFPIHAEALKEILIETLSPRLEQMGLTPSANYIWHDQAAKEVRRTQEIDRRAL
jgi:hypothetical protein